jgi:hypothetical protein
MTKSKAQSFLEFALILPILLIILLGVIELTFFIGRYIDLVDLTREAARFASNRDPFSTSQVNKTNCSATGEYNFFIDTACVFSPLKGSACPYPEFCNGFNASIPLKSDEDDVLISIFTETGTNERMVTVTPGGSGTPSAIKSYTPIITGNAATNPWVWSNHSPDPDTAHRNNWRRDCDRRGNNPYNPADPNNTANLLQANPFFTTTNIQSYLRGGAMPDKGFVTVEVYYCYYQVINAPLISSFIPNPILIHTYTIMPLPAAQPTATPRPTPTP